ncbi:hypothetical protein GWK47_027311 [Chionoecetes opilio]|uniref:Uncharacterized protein n=1 Tax=Chionoecetes opilio TaxID=41210 RepID=A0A8J8WMH1_CHIOP|nr:hypothetical protein GWK47_027311 [Chionoecetes opilio]
MVTPPLKCFKASVPKGKCTRAFTLELYSTHPSAVPGRRTQTLTLHSPVKGRTATTHLSINQTLKHRPRGQEGKVPLHQKNKAPSFRGARCSQLGKHAILLEAKNTPPGVSKHSRGGFDLAPKIPSHVKKVAKDVPGKTLHPRVASLLALRESHTLQVKNPPPEGNTRPSHSSSPPSPSPPCPG